jgi:hypothetical protein
MKLRLRNEPDYLSLNENTPVASAIFLINKTDRNNTNCKILINIHRFTNKREFQNTIIPNKKTNGNL